MSDDFGSRMMTLGHRHQARKAAFSAVLSAAGAVIYSVPMDLMLAQGHQGGHTVPDTLATYLGQLMSFAAQNDQVQLGLVVITVATAVALYLGREAVLDVRRALDERYLAGSPGPLPILVGVTPIIVVVLNSILSHDQARALLNQPVEWLRVIRLALYDWF